MTDNHKTKGEEESTNRNASSVDIFVDECEQTFFFQVFRHFCDLFLRECLLSYITSRSSGSVNPDRQRNGLKMGLRSEPARTIASQS